MREKTVRNAAIAVFEETDFKEIDLCGVCLKGIDLNSADLAVPPRRSAESSVGSFARLMGKPPTKMFILSDVESEEYV